MEFHIPIQLIPGAISQLTLLLFLYCLAQWKKKTDTIEKQPPLKSNSWPIIGHLHLLKGLSHIALGKLTDQYGPIFMFKLGVRRALVVSTAEMAKECLGGTNDKVFLNRPQTTFIEYTTYESAMFGFSPYGQYWREIHKIVTVELHKSAGIHRLGFLCSPSHFSRFSQTSAEDLEKYRYALLSTGSERRHRCAQFSYFVCS